MKQANEKVFTELWKVLCDHLLVCLLTCVPGILVGTKGLKSSKNKHSGGCKVRGLSGGGRLWSKVERTFQRGGQSRKKEKCLHVWGLYFHRSWRANSYCRNESKSRRPLPRNLDLVPTGDGGAAKLLKLETPELGRGKQCRHGKEVSHVGGMGQGRRPLALAVNRLQRPPVLWSVCGKCTLFE